MEGWGRLKRTAGASSWILRNHELARVRIRTWTVPEPTLPRTCPDEGMHQTQRIASPNTELPSHRSIDAPTPAPPSSRQSQPCFSPSLSSVEQQPNSNWTPHQPCICLYVYLCRNGYVCLKRKRKHRFCLPIFLELVRLHGIFSSIENIFLQLVILCVLRCLQGQ